MSNLKWQLGAPSNASLPIVLDITTTGSPSQMYLGMTWPNDDNGMTQGDADDVTAAAVTAIEGLDGVTDCTATTLSVAANPANTEIAWLLVFDSSDYTCYTYDVTGPDGAEVAWLVSASPTDSVLTGGQVETIQAAVLDAIAALGDVSASSGTLSAITPATV